MRRRRRFRIYQLIAVSVLVLEMLLKGCASLTPIIGPASASIMLNLADVKIKEQQNNSWFPLSKENPSRNLNHGDQVTTNQNGEGWLNINSCPQTIYIFQDSQLITSPNSKADRKSGNDTSLVEGSAAWNNHCANHVVIHTDSAQIELKGTWVLVTYLPAQQLTLLMVLEGRAELQPVLDSNTGRLGTAIDVPSGNFLFSTPGDSPSSIANLAAREPHSLDQLQPLIKELNLWTWIAKTKEKARKDGIPFPEFLTAQCRIVEEPPNLRELPGMDAKVLITSGELAVDSLFEGMAQDETGWIFGISSKVIGNSANAIGWVSPNYLNCPSPLPTVVTPPRGIALEEESSVPPPSPTPSPTNTAPAQDTTPPTIISLAISPEKPTTEDQVTFTSEAQDNESGIDRIEILIDGSLVHTCQDTRCTATVGPYSIDSESKDRTVNYQVQAYDRAGNPTSQSGSFVISPKISVDTTPPTITVNVSPPEPTVYDPITITVSAEDPESSAIKTGISVYERLTECEGSTCSVKFGPYYQVGENGLDISYLATALNGANIPASQEGKFHVSPPPPKPAPPSVEEIVPARPNSLPVPPSPGKVQPKNFNDG